MLRCKACICPEDLVESRLYKHWARFIAYRLKNPGLVYQSLDISSAHECLDNYAFAVPSELECSNNYTEESAFFYAERYGGAGIGSNGGSGRCGTSGPLQIKGIGRTPLIGRKEALGDVWHSHGGVALVDAIQECVWGEVFAQALPYGAVRVASIIVTGTDCWYEAADGAQIHAPRALIVRQSAARPAHFMRAMFFGQRGDILTMQDVARTRCAVLALPEILPQNPMGPASREPVGTVLSGLKEMALRFARQCAAAQVKRLMHGALIPSNLAIDGRWLDFGTASQLPTFANTKSAGAPRSFATLWEEHKGIAGILQDLCFYINKYLLVPNYATQIDPQDLAQYYADCYQNSLVSEATIALGIPSDVVEICPSLRGLAEGLTTCMRRSSSKRIESATLDLTVYGEIQIGKILYNIVLERFEEVERLVENRLISMRLIASYMEFSSMFEKTAQSIKLSHVRVLLQIGARKLGYSISRLFRHNMVAQNRNLALRHLPVDQLRANVEDAVTSLRRSASFLLAPTHLRRSCAYDDGIRRIEFDAERGLWTSYLHQRKEWEGPSLLTELSLICDRFYEDDLSFRSTSSIPRV